MSLAYDGVNDWVDCRAGGATIPWINGVAQAVMLCWARVATAGVIGHILGASINNGGVATPTSRMSLERSVTGAIESFNEAPDGGAFQNGNDNGAGSLPANVSTFIGVRTNVTADTVTCFRDTNAPVVTAVAFVPATFSATNSASAALAADEDGSGTFYGGRLEDSRCYNRLVADDEMQTIQACNGHDGIWFGIQCRYLQNEGSPGAAAAGAGIIKDITDGQRHGTPTNGPTWQESERSFKRRFI